MFPTHLTAFRVTPMMRITMQKYAYSLVLSTPIVGIMPISGVSDATPNMTIILNLV